MQRPYWRDRPHTVYMAVLYAKQLGRQTVQNMGRAKECGRRGQHRRTRTTIIRHLPADQTPIWSIIKLRPASAPPYTRPDAWLSASVLHDRSLILRVGFGGKLSDEDIVEIECLRVVAMATSFGTKIAINWLFVDDSD